MNPSITSEVSGKVSDGQKTTLVRLIEDAARKAAGVVVDELSAAGVLNGSSAQRVLAQGDAIVSAVTTVIKEKIAALAGNIVGCLKLISGGKTLVLGATDGKDNLNVAYDAFAYIDSDFTNYGCNVEGQPTEATPVQVYEMIKNGTFAEIFGGFGENLDRLCLTQTQIKKFVQNHRDMVCTDGNETFFLFKVSSEFFVACVRVDDDDGSLEVNADRFSDDDAWHAEGRHRIVVPQLN